jgi:malonate-semialdehyde dehydrogenase (acetylating)/methylmalonate-semialdehyde dehydrogenase
MPDADMDTAIRIITDSAFGCAGQRCLAASLIITVGEAKEKLISGLIEAASSRTCGSGLSEESDMGPVITSESKKRIVSIIQEGIDEGGKLLLDGREARAPEFDRGNFINPTIISDVKPGSKLHTTEIFGPVLSLMHSENLADAINIVNQGTYGNSACIFTRDGAVARKFRHDAIAGNIGINIGVAAPMAFFPFSGWKGSFFGDLHGQSRHAVEFYTQTKVVIERWHNEWNRKF